MYFRSACTHYFHWYESNSLQFFYSNCYIWLKKQGKKQVVKKRTASRSSLLETHIACGIQHTKHSYMLLYASKTDDGFIKFMELSLEDWFPIQPWSWLHLYSLPVALWPLVLLWCGRKKHKPGWGRESEGWGIAIGENVYSGSWREVEIFL